MQAELTRSVELFGFAAPDLLLLAAEVVFSLAESVSAVLAFAIAAVTAAFDSAATRLDRWSAGSSMCLPDLFQGVRHQSLHACRTCQHMFFVELHAQEVGHPLCDLCRHVSELGRAYLHLLVRRGAFQPTNHSLKAFHTCLGAYFMPVLIEKADTRLRTSAAVAIFSGVGNMANTT